MEEIQLRTFRASFAGLSLQQKAKIINDLIGDDDASVIGTMQVEKGRGFLSGLPPISKAAGSNSRSSENYDHKPAVNLGKPFCSLDFEPIHAPSIIWDKVGRKKALTWHSENDIQAFVRDVLQDAIAAAGLDLHVECYTEITTGSNRGDVWVVLINKVPIGIIEVKKPDDKIMDSSLLHGQILDYMLRLRNFHGLREVFGIITTYEQWRFCWLPDADEMAALEHLDKTEESRRPVLTLPPDVPDLQVHESIDVSGVQESTVPRKIHSSPIFMYDDLLLPRLLVSLIRKMFASTTQPISLVDLNKSYVALNERTFYWCSLSAKFRFRIGGMPRSHANAFLLLADLHGGIHGRVWLAATHTGAACVIKFPRRDIVPSLERESGLWKIIWDEHAVRIATLGGVEALVMPYLKACTDEDIANEEVQQVARTAIKRMVSRGYRHNDLHWRHVGLYRHEKNLAAVLFDLADVSEVHDPHAREEAEFSMLSKLSLVPLSQDK